MGTRSYIAKQLSNHQYLTIFCHFNGYPEENGATLVKYYNTPDRVEALLALGDLYYLREKLDPATGIPHNHGNAQPGVTVAYHRDEGWPECNASLKTLEQLDDPGLDGIEFTYIFVQDGQWLYFPTGEAELGIRNVKKDLDADTIRYGSLCEEVMDNLGLLNDGEQGMSASLSLDP